MSISEARKRANKKYDAKTYERINLMVKKGEKEKIRAFAAARGESVNGFINRLIREAMGREK